MFGREHGSRPGAGGLASAAETAVARKERLKQLALEKIDLSKDPYFHKTHTGSYECRLCLTIHVSEANYLAHTQGKRHQQNLKARELKDAKDRGVPLKSTTKVVPKIKYFEKIGTPGYSLTKQIDSTTGKKSIYVVVSYPQIANDVVPLFRVMGSFEQHVEPCDNAFQYLVIAAEPYNTIAFKIPNNELQTDQTTGKCGETTWDNITKTYTVKITYI
ncbi:splicing factor 3A subunit, putative [Entamoeba invadens IP1]|uniref:Splicing factor 3A subunit, putative n=1 Tax=Entamoeba invadens IP1 TaxID=370355 RepID=A0A0A1U0T2_ENTIV|nr:splicing factor 3A subunit, putative [Entamoeba invadens IP1]ELP87510.1 splicing factor 3A subunit, putative [Entamoeba invadens IP1]|eukprot:XP_004254281.1 splicing factor 3A subunit, putative [Entamoeba invadens IP1]